LSSVGRNAEIDDSFESFEKQLFKTVQEKVRGSKPLHTTSKSIKTTCPYILC
jgi:hypothetical protein